MSDFTIIKAVAGEALTSAQYLAVYVDGSDGERVKAADGAADAYSSRVLGILQNAPADDAVAEVCIKGFCLARAGAAIEPYDYIQVENSTGRVIPLADGECIGQFLPALVDATATGRDAADGDLVRVLLFPRKQGQFTQAVTIDFDSTATDAVDYQTVTVNGAEVGDTCTISCDGLTEGVILFANVDAANSVTVTMFNKSASNPLDLASDTYYITVHKKA